ncbi:MAG: hypothetical protein Tsb0020_39080 [Haliangiales bacterium]
MSECDATPRSLSIWRRAAAHLLALAIAAGLALGLPGCGTVAPSQQLISARDAYARAAGGDAQKLVPDRVLSAKQALDQAEAAEEDDPGSPVAVTEAYVAERKAMLAETHARIAIARRERQQAKEAYQAELEARHDKAQSALSRTSDRLDQTRGTLTDRERRLAELEAELAKRAQELADREAEIAKRDQTVAQQNQALSQREQELARERAAREAAEARYRAAIKSLEEVAQVREDERGTVLTFSGAVLFGSGKARLLPIAREQLLPVAQALGDVEDQKRITVEGHTDSRGSERSNLRLSRRRADAVRRFLVQNGAPARRVRAVGKGESTPVADNDTAEGRASNRRVEIIINDIAE